MRVDLNSWRQFATLVFSGQAGVPQFFLTLSPLRFKLPLSRGLRRWDEKCDIAPKDFRNTLQTHAMEHAIDEGWNTYLVDRYVGHAPQTVAERHYFGDKKGRMVEVFREHVAAKIDTLIERIEKAEWHKMAQTISVVPFLRGLSRS